jgi:hypothetical protein
MINFDSNKNEQATTPNETQVQTKKQPTRTVLDIVRRIDIAHV